MTNKTEKLIITGPSGSGKDFLLRGLLKKELRYYPKFTTRPKRLLETEGIEYNFIDNKTFELLNSEGQIKVYQSFLIGEDTWYYGVTKQNFDENQLFIMTPFEINQLSEDDLKSCFVVYLDIDMEIRRKRISKRNDNNDSIERRLEADEIDFKNYKYYDLKLTDPEFEAEWVYNLMN
jgi:guanylate kinase